MTNFLKIVNVMLRIVQRFSFTQIIELACEKETKTKFKIKKKLKNK